jgi:hypothetical protein
LPNNKEHLEAPSFRGTNKLKFTANEQALIKEAEQAYRYRSQPSPEMTLGRALGRLLAAAITALLLGSLVAALIARTGGARKPLFDMQTEVLAADAQTQSQAIVSDSPAAQEAIGIREQLPTGTSAPSRGLIGTDGRVVFGEDPPWQEVEAESRTLLFAEPRFDAQILGNILPDFRYFVIDIRQSCGEVEGLTWKIAYIRSGSGSFRGSVCTPEQPKEAERDGTQTPDGDE